MADSVRAVVKQVLSRIIADELKREHQLDLFKALRCAGVNHTILVLSDKPDAEICQEMTILTGSPPVDAALLLSNTALLACSRFWIQEDSGFYRVFGFT